MIHISRYTAKLVVRHVDAFAMKQRDNSKNNETMQRNRDIHDIFVDYTLLRQ